MDTSGLKLGSYQGLLWGFQTCRNHFRKLEKVGATWSHFFKKYVILIYSFLAHCTKSVMN